MRGKGLLIALGLSLAVHAVSMYYARPQVMTYIATGVASPTRQHGPMRVVKRNRMPDPVRIEALRDVDARRGAPVAKSAANLRMEDGNAIAVKTPETERLFHDVSSRPSEATVFDARPISLKGPKVSATLPMKAIEMPVMKDAAIPMPDFGKTDVVRTLPRANPVLPAVGKDASSVFLPSQIMRSPLPNPVMSPRAEPKRVASFKPAQEVFKEVDEKVVQEEKAAVRRLVDVEKPVELEKFVNVTLTSESSGKWTYFKVMITPRTTLKAVPKDVVVLLDASGSIGSDRLGSVRRAAKGILRSATNTGDRFNLVAFRDRFSYAFRRWQDCTRTSFEQADRWLGNLAAHGRTDVFSTISSVLTLPRDPTRPLIALVVTDGDANEGVSGTSQILSRFTRLNDGLVSIYMYGVRESCNRELIDLLTHGNRGESFVFDGWRWNAGDGIEGLSERFRDPVLSDLRIVFSVDSRAESYPRLLKNIYAGEVLSFVGRVPAGTTEVGFSLRGLNGAHAHEGFFKLPVVASSIDGKLEAEWLRERAIDEKLR